MNATVIIPSLNPDEKIISTVKSLLNEGFEDIILVDDGSREEYKKYFEEAKKLPGVSLLVHDVNRGKGRAMKTAFEYILQNRPNRPNVITVDGDGQHLASDVKKCIELLEANPHAFVLGVRNFRQANVPARSQFGNTVTRLVFRLLCGIKVSDTQTGLRAIPFEHLEMMTKVDGDRYEYETNQLFAVKQAGIEFKEAVINTVYIEENQTSHFRPIRDSIRIYGIIIRYIASSLASTVVDISLFTILNLLFGKIGFSDEMRIILAEAIARLVSSFVNFSINRKVVFKSKDKYGATMLKYYILCVCQLAASTGLVYLFSKVIFQLTDGSLFDTLIKVVVDGFLFFLSFRIQQNWVFAPKKNK
ncbi:MAG: bifunctional glycosyltransferase family 2/GtrA family protein [Lachnospiraceae bacterium]|nr:bifunctional glycosyltransferase family 2/GtrA family protein [Lachnospiraceae bacterium]